MHHRRKHHAESWIGVLLLGVLLLMAACGNNASSTEEAEIIPPASEQVAEPSSNAAAGNILEFDLGVPLERINVSMPAELAQREGFFESPPPHVLVEDRFYYAVIRTGGGDIVVQLFADRTPVTVNNFVYLALTGYYDGTIFHRVLEDFMAQGGDPTGRGTGGPGYRFQDEFVGNLMFDRPYLLAMANAGPATNGSQFFITFVPTLHLNQRHTIFGEVISGQVVVDGLTRRDPQAGGPADMVETIEVYESADSLLPAPAPTPVPTSTPEPTPVPTPYAPSQVMEEDARPLAALEPVERKSLFNMPPDLVLERGQPYGVTLESNYGSIILELFPENAFEAVNNFAVLADIGFFDRVPVFYSPQSHVFFLGVLDGTQEGMVGYTLPGGQGHVTESPRAGMLFYLSDFTDPNLVQGGALILIPDEMSLEGMSQSLVIGGLVQGWETLAQWLENPDVVLERVDVFAGEAGPAEPRPTPRAEKQDNESS